MDEKMKQNLEIKECTVRLRKLDAKILDAKCIYLNEFKSHNSESSSSVNSSNLQKSKPSKQFIANKDLPNNNDVFINLVSSSESEESDQEYISRKGRSRIEESDKGHLPRSKTKRVNYRLYKENKTEERSNRKEGGGWGRTGNIYSRTLRSKFSSQKNFKSSNSSNFGSINSGGNKNIVNLPSSKRCKSAISTSPKTNPDEDDVAIVFVPANQNNSKEKMGVTADKSSFSVSVSAKHQTSHSTHTLLKKSSQNFEKTSQQSNDTSTSQSCSINSSNISLHTSIDDLLCDREDNASQHHSVDNTLQGHNVNNLSLGCSVSNLPRGSNFDILSQCSVNSMSLLSTNENVTLGLSSSKITECGNDSLSLATNLSVQLNNIIKNIVNKYDMQLKKKVICWCKCEFSKKGFLL